MNSLLRVALISMLGCCVHAAVYGFAPYNYKINVLQGSFAAPRSILCTIGATQPQFEMFIFNSVNLFSRYSIQGYGSAPGTLVQLDVGRQFHATAVSLNSDMQVRQTNTNYILIATTGVGLPILRLDMSTLSPATGFGSAVSGKSIPVIVPVRDNND